MNKNICKILCLTLSAAVLAAVFAGCAKKGAEEQPTATPGETTDAATEPTVNVAELAGAWTFATEFEAVELPEGAKEAFEKATEGMDGAKYEAVAYLGSQVVAGANYAYLCKVTPVVPNAEGELKVVKIYADLQGGASVLDTADLYIPTEVQELDFEQLAGGFTYENAVGKLNEDDQAIFDKATAGLNGAGYAPLVRVASQVVAGRNILFLCKATRVTAEPATALALVTVFAGLDGNAEMTSVTGFHP